MKEFPVFAFEVDELKEKLETFNKLRQEISELWVTANEQWSESFWHDNPILEAKQEKERMMSLMLPEVRRIEQLLHYCLTISEDGIIKRDWEISLWSIVTYSINNWSPITALITWVVQGKKVIFKWQEYMSVSRQSPIRKWLEGKKIWDSSIINIWGEKRAIKIINIE